METFPTLLALCAGNSPVTGEFPSQRPVTMFSLICAWINDWVNNREAGDLRRHRDHYDVIVMIMYCIRCYKIWLCDLLTHVNQCWVIVNLTHFGWVQHTLIYASVKYATIGSDNGWSPIRQQVIIWTKTGLLLIGSLEFEAKYKTFPWKMHLKIWSAKLRPFCCGLHVFRTVYNQGFRQWNKTHK